MTKQSENDHQQLRALVRGAYDMQKLRIQTGNRLVANFRAKLGIAPGESDDESDKEATDMLKQLRASYTLLTEGIARNRTLPKSEGFTGDELISEWSELALVAQYIELEKVESQQFGRLDTVLGKFPVYTEWMSRVRGLGPAMSAVIISEIDIHKNKTVAGLWKLAGLDVAEDGMGRSRRAEHLVDRTYTDRDGRDQMRKSVTFKPFLKTKLMGVMATSFLRSGSEYAKLYHDYKTRVQNDPAKRKMPVGEWKKLRQEDPAAAKAAWTPGRIHSAAMRYMVKIFLKDLYLRWRELESLPITEPYSERKLGLGKHPPLVA